MGLIIILLLFSSAAGANDNQWFGDWRDRQIEIQTQQNQELFQRRMIEDQTRQNLIMQQQLNELRRNNEIEQENIWSKAMIDEFFKWLHLILPVINTGLLVVLVRNSNHQRRKK